MAYGKQYGGHKGLPFVRTYAEADWLFSNSKPIRGRTPNASPGKYTALRPLGERRYVDAYSINKTAEGAVQLINYRSPVVTLYPDGRVVVKPYWVSMSTAQFISEVTPVSARCTKGFMVFSLGMRNDPQYACKKDDQIEFMVEHAPNNLGSWSLLCAPKQKHYVLNRTGANIVRVRFRAFYRYVEGFMKLRMQSDDPTVFLQMTEIVDAVGSRDTVYMLDKPQNGYSHQKNNDVAWDRWEREVEEFVRLISTADTDPGQASAFYTAMMLMAREHAGTFWKSNMHGGVFLTKPIMRETLDAILFKFYSEECISYVDVEEGKVPSTKYNRYMTKRG